ncbi:sulfotransferase family protein [Hoeflea sp. WL0058]|uniref:Sulfotransferase family protein n=1 Tax=Flavimaribacter sediminis TaxID=2865987 RepID=A0AAE2ZM25_9HYPH|nr:sulfotransferase family 2 domain-containing protein [Flavimaribacter sediminis]MBW8639078.1 sulfotransferase family protein [Flavimaribacter sediminis]
MVTNDILWSERYPYLYGACSKNACSSIKFSLALIENDLVHFDGSPHNRRATNLKGLLQANEQKLSALLQSPDVFRFNFCRDPYARLVSAYENRILTLGLESYDLVDSATKEFKKNRTAILAHKSGRHPSSVDPDEDIEFGDFVRFICDQNYFEMDRHWYPQARSMHVDVIDYQFTGRLESFDQDWRIVHETITGGMSAEPATRLNSTRKRADGHEQIPQDLRRLIAKKYEEDFDAFRYPTGLRATTTMPKNNIEQATPTKTSNMSAALPRVLFVIDARDDAFRLRPTLASIERLTSAPHSVAAIVSRNYSCFARYLTNLVDEVAEVDGLEPLNCLGSLFKEANTDQDIIVFLRAGEEVPDRFAFHEACNLLAQRPETKVVAGLNAIIRYDEWEKPQSRKWNNTASYFVSRPDEPGEILIPTDFLEPPKYGAENWHQICEAFWGPFVCSLRTFRGMRDAGKEYCSMAGLCLAMARQWSLRTNGAVAFYPKFIAIEKVHGARNAINRGFPAEDIRQYFADNDKGSLDILGLESWIKDASGKLSTREFQFMDVDNRIMHDKSREQTLSFAFDSEFGPRTPHWSDLRPKPSSASITPSANGSVLEGQASPNANKSRRKSEIQPQTIDDVRDKYGILINANGFEIISTRRLVRNAAFEFIRRPFLKKPPPNNSGPDIN